MKEKYSPEWNSSVRPSKQRKFRLFAPLHKKHKFLSANLSKDLRVKHGKRNLPLRKGDEVLVMRGFFKKKKAKVTSVNVKTSLATLESLQKTKKDGSKVNVFFHPSNLQIITLDLSDKERLSSVNRKGSVKSEAKVNKETKPTQTKSTNTKEKK